MPPGTCLAARVRSLSLHAAEHGLRNGRSVLQLTLRVTRPDGTRFDLVQDKAVPPGAIAQVQAGSAVRVKFLPHDESEVALVMNLVP